MPKKGAKEKIAKPLLLPERTQTYLLLQHNRKIRQRLYFGLIGLVALVSLVLGLLSAWLDDHSLTKVQMAGIVVTHDMSAPQVKQEINSRLQNYQVKAYDYNGKLQSYKLSDAGLVVDINASANHAKAAQATGGDWQHIQWWKHSFVPLVVRVDSKTLNDFISNKISKTLKPMQNANISIDNGTAKLTSEVAGSQFGLDNAQQQILTAVANLNSQPLRPAVIPLKPAIRAPDLQANKQVLDKILAQTITFTINGHIVSAKSTDIASWVDLNPVTVSKTVDLTINSGKVLDYIDKIAEPYIYPPRSQLVLNQNDGSQQILVSGLNGEDVVNKQQVAKDVAAQVLAAKGFREDLPVKFAAFTTIEAGDYDKFIVVDVNTKRMYAYEHASLVNSFLVSAGAPATPTVLGQYKVYAKFEEQDMRGANADGSRYYQPNVQWVNYFYKDYAIHGNYWRPTSYFGNINSSHGCVGVVNSDAKWIYDWAPVGTPVIVHN